MPRYGRKKSHNYINDTEIEVQRRRTAGWEVGLNHTQYIGEQCYNCLRTINVVRVGIKPYLLRKRNLGEGTSRMQILSAGVDLPILSLSAINLSALTPVGMDNGTAHL